jgi:hypothetical protein
VYKKIWDDNNSFLNERQLNSSDFFEFFSNLIKAENIENLVATGNKELLHDVYMIVKKVIFELLVYSSNNASIKDLTDKFRQILEADNDCVTDLGEYIVQNDSQEMIRILLKCPDHQVRQSISLILATEVNRLFQLEELILGSEIILENGKTQPNSRAELFMTHVFSAIQIKAPESWMKFEDFFRLIFRVCIGGDKQLDFFNRNHMLATLGDFFLGPTSPIKPADEK